MNENFGRYQLVERIALGGFAEIFKAQAVGIAGFEKTLAIKRLHPRYSQDSDFIAWMVDEAKITSQLSHANICQVLDFAKVDGHYFIAMEYIEGRDVYRLMKKLRESKGVAPIELVAFIGREACQALDYTHRKRDSEGNALEIVHRDMSPQNVMVSLDGDVKIIDFGIAKSRVRAYETEAGIIKGKFFYMSPEQARGEDLDPRTDLFSLGIVLWELVTGELLYKDDDEVTLLSQVRRASINPPNSIRSDIPNGLNRIIMKALNRDRSERYVSAFEMQKDLERFLVRHNSKYGAAQVGYWMRSTFFDELPQKAIENIESFRSRADFMAEEFSLIGEAATGNDLTRPHSEHGSDVVVLDSDLIQPMDSDSVIVSRGQGRGDEFYDDAPTAAAESIEALEENTPMAGLGLPSSRRGNESPTVEPNPQAVQAPFEAPQSAPASGSVKSAPWAKKASFEHSATEVGEVPTARASKADQTPSYPRPNRGGDHNKRTLIPKGAGRASELLGRFKNESVYVALVLLLIFGAVLSVTLMWKKNAESPAVAVSEQSGQKQGENSRIGSVMDSVFGDSKANSKADCAEFNIVNGKKVCASRGPQGATSSRNANRSRLQIITNPSGATVFVNENRYPIKTPTELSRRPEESVRITLQLPNYETVNTVVRMPKAGKLIEFRKTLEKPLGTLIVNSEPSGASILIDEQYRGDTPSDIPNLRLDRTQVLRVEKKGYRDEERIIRWASTDKSETKSVNVDLVRLRSVKRKRTVAKRSVRSRARKVKRKTRPKPRARVQPERREPEVRRGKGKLRVQTRPWSSVYLNGRLLARETPIFKSVDEGRYRLKVCFEGDNSRCITRRVRIDANQETLERFRE